MPQRQRGMDRAPATPRRKKSDPESAVRRNFRTWRTAARRDQIQGVLWRPVAIRRGGLRGLIGRTGVRPLRGYFWEAQGGFLRLDRLYRAVRFRTSFRTWAVWLLVGGGWMAGLGVDLEGRPGLSCAPGSEDAEDLCM
jgi:hypothetical protein